MEFTTGFAWLGIRFVDLLLAPLNLVDECVLYCVLLFVCVTAYQAIMDMLYMFSGSMVSCFLNVE